MLRRGGYFAALTSFVLFWGGCGGAGGDRWTADRPRTVRVSGTVLYNQKPVEGAAVVFVPQGHEQGATGRTDSSGRFELQTFQPKDGAVPGEYKVTVRKVEVAGAGEEDAPEFDDDTPYGEERSLIPERYGVPETTELTATVSEDGENRFPFELTD